MDPLSAFAIACGVIQIVDFSSKLVSTAKEVYEDGSPKAIKELMDQTSEMNKMLSELKRSQLSASATQDTAEASSEILLLAGKCDKTTEKLLEELNKMQISGPSSVISAVGKSLKMRGRLKKVEKLNKELDSYQSLLDTRYLMDLSTKLNRLTLEQEAGFKKLDESHQAHVKAFADGANSCRSLADVISNNVGQQFQDREAENQRKAYEKDFLDGLFFSEITERERGVKRAHEETFGWIFDVSGKKIRPWSNFAEWLESGSGIYWVSGKLGSGKSTLMGYIIRSPQTRELLTTWAGSDEKLLMPRFYFWKAGGSLLLKSLAGFFRSVIFQILVEHPSLIRQISKNHLAYPGYSHALTVWTEEDLRECFFKLIQAISGSFHVCLFIDGLDEYNGDHRALVQLIEDLASRPNVKCCVSSRPERPFEHLTENMLRLQDLNSDDISEYVDSKLDEVPQVQSSSTEFSSDIKERLKETIIWKAEGVFLWVELAVKSQINGMGNNDDIDLLEKRLQSLPTEIDDLYYEMLMRIDVVYREETAWYLGMTSDLIDLSENDVSWSLGNLADPNVLILTLVKYGLTDSLHLSHGIGLHNIASVCSRVSERIPLSCAGFLEFYEIFNQETSEEDKNIFTTSHPKLVRWARQGVRFVHRSAEDFLDSKSRGGDFLRSYRAMPKITGLVPSAICLVMMTLSNQEDCREYMCRCSSALMSCAGETEPSLHDEVSASLDLLEYFDNAIQDLYRRKHGTLHHEWISEWCVAAPRRTVLDSEGFLKKKFTIPPKYSPSDLTSLAAWFDVTWLLLEKLNHCSISVERANQLAVCLVVHSEVHLDCSRPANWTIVFPAHVEVLRLLVHLGADPSIGCLTSIWDQVLLRIFHFRFNSNDNLYYLEAGYYRPSQVFETFSKSGANPSQRILIPGAQYDNRIRDQDSHLAGFEFEISRIVPSDVSLEAYRDPADGSQSMDNVKRQDKWPLRLWLRDESVVEQAKNIHDASVISYSDSDSYSVGDRDDLSVVGIDQSFASKDIGFQNDSPSELEATPNLRNRTLPFSRRSFSSIRSLWSHQEYTLSEDQVSQFYKFLKQIFDAPRHSGSRAVIYQSLDSWIG